MTRPTTAIPIFDELKSAHEVPEQERLAKEKGLNFIKLDGDVGHHRQRRRTRHVDARRRQGGGRRCRELPRRGRWCGGRAAVERARGHHLGQEVKSVLINIFGGITRCDLVAEGIIDAFGRLDVQVPIVVRLDGTNAEQGRKMLADAPHPNADCGGDDAGRRRESRRAGASRRWR